MEQGHWCQTHYPPSHLGNSRTCSRRSSPLPRSYSITPVAANDPPQEIVKADLVVVRLDGPCRIPWVGIHRFAHSHSRYPCCSVLHGIAVYPPRLSSAAGCCSGCGHRWISPRYPVPLLQGCATQGCPAAPRMIMSVLIDDHLPHTFSIDTKRDS